MVTGSILTSTLQNLIGFFFSTRGLSKVTNNFTFFYFLFWDAQKTSEK